MNWGPNWAGSGAARPVQKALTPKFDQFVYTLGLEKRPDLWARDARIYLWVKENGSTHYVPEWLLQKMNLRAKDDVA